MTHPEAGDSDKSKAEFTNPVAESEKKLPGSYEQLFSHCYRMARVEDGDLVPVGGTSRSETNILVEADLSNLNVFIEENHAKTGRINLGNLQEWLDKSGLEIDAATFAPLYTFTTLLNPRFPPAENRSQIRRELYTGGTTRKLSDVMRQGAGECAEIALLAQAVLQRQGIQSVYVSGDRVSNQDQEFSSEHSFLIIDAGEKKYIYDPAKPVSTNAGDMPGIYDAPPDLEKVITRGQKGFVAATNMLSQKTAYFGVNNGTNIALS